MKTVNSLSGGRTSSYMAVHYPADYEVFSLVCIDDINSKPKDKFIIDYVNKKLSSFSQFGEFIATAEDDKTIVAMINLEQFIGREILWVRGKSFDQVIDEGTKTRLPSWARRYCTLEMKIKPIFDFWFNNIFEKVNMRIGFRFDEIERMFNFFNNPNHPGIFKTPISTNTYGAKRQNHQDFNWRNCYFPLVKDCITENVIIDFWDKKGIIPADLFNEEIRIQFPKISNCVGCFHKKIETINAMSKMHPEKMQWFSNQENKGKGTWLDSKVKYIDIFEMNKNVIPHLINEELELKSCDFGGCNG